MNIKIGQIPIAFLFLVFLVLGIISIILTLWSILKKGDERKKAIILHASHWTFIQIIVILFINIIYYIGIIKEQVKGINSIVFLSIIGIIYLVNLLISKKKYGG